MKQLAQNLRSGKLSIDEVPDPIVLPGQVLVQTAFSLISAGTERTKIETGRKSLIGKAIARPDQVRQVMQSYRQLGLKSTYEKVKTKLDARSPMGYSASGIILKVGEGVNGFKPGDDVACAGAGAAHAEIILVPENLCVPVPASVNLEAAAFATVGAIALQGIRQAKPQLGEVAAVIGLGLLGQLTIQMLKAAGCKVIGFDLNTERCALAEKSGVDYVASSEASLRLGVNQLTFSKGVDAVLITAGTSSNRPVEIAGEISRDKGQVIIVGAVGLTVPRPPYYEKELDLRLSRSYGPGRYDPTYEDKGIDYPYGFVRWTERRNMIAFLDLIANGKVNVDSLITHRFPIDKAEEAYGLISGKIPGSSLGVLFQYNHEDREFAQRINLARSRSEVNGNLGVGVIGAGSFAQSMLLPYLKNNTSVDLQGVATIVPVESRDVAERFSFQYATSDPEEIINDPRIRAVVIATRHDSHAALVLQALECGKSIHVEKPLAMDDGQVEAIKQSYYSKKAQAPFLMVGFNRRFAPMVQAVLKHFAGHQEPLAITYRVNAGYIPLNHWTQDDQQGGGRIIGEVCHFLDLIQCLGGALIRTVYAQVLPNQGRYNNDNVAINVSLMNGSIGTILYVANGDKSLPKEYIEVFGEGKVAILDDYRELSLYSNDRHSKSHEGARDKGHKEEMAAWVRAIRKGEKEPIPFEESIRSTRASLAAIHSLSTGQAVTME